MVLHREDNRLLVITANIRLIDSHEVQNSTLAILDMLGPHMQRAFQMQRLIGTSQLVNKNYREMLEMAGNAIFLIDAKGRVSYQNSLAETLLSVGEVFYLDISKCLHAVDTDADNAIAQSLCAIKTGGLTGLHDTIVLRAKNSQPTVFAAMLPFRPDHDATMIFSDFCSTSLPIAMLTVVDPSIIRNSPRRALTTLYRLTPAETELAEALYYGQSLKIYSETKGISIHTVRSHLKTIFSKTDTNSQSELVVLIGRIMA